LCSCTELKRIYYLALDELKNDEKLPVLIKEEIDYLQSNTVELKWLSKHTDEEIDSYIEIMFQRKRKDFLQLWIQNNKVKSEKYIQKIYDMFNGRYIYSYIVNQLSNVNLSTLVDLQVLDLHNQIIDISPLASLVNLQKLCLSVNQITDTSHLASLVNLQQLVLSNNQIVDISPLASLVNLQKLALRDNRIVDISHLTSLVNLQELYLNTNQIVDISPLASLVNLQYLDLYNNQITDVSPLASLVNLQQLDLSFNQITDISPLTNLYCLKEIGLLGMHIFNKSLLQVFAETKTKIHLTTFNSMGYF
jgi:hypothetical protein